MRNRNWGNLINDVTWRTASKGARGIAGMKESGQSLEGSARKKVFGDKKVEEQGQAVRLQILLKRIKEKFAA